MLLFPVFVALQALFTIGVALMLATGTAFFRDVRHLVDVALAVLFWMTPIVYTVAGLSPTACVARSCSARCRRTSPPTTTSSTTGSGRTPHDLADRGRLRRRRARCSACG